MDADGTMPEEQEAPPEQVQPSIDDMSGPQMRVRYNTGERQSVVLDADDDFGPFLVVLFNDPYASVPISFPGGNLSLAQMDIITKEIALRIAQMAQDAAARQRSTGVLKPGRDFQTRPAPIGRGKGRSSRPRTRRP